MAAVAFACESQSIRRVAWSALARHAAKFTAVVVFPTPPFWLAMAMTRAKVLPQAGENSRAGTGKQDVSRGTVEISGSATAAGILLDRHGTHLFEFGDMSPADCVSLAL